MLPVPSPPIRSLDAASSSQPDMDNPKLLLYGLAAVAASWLGKTWYDRSKFARIPAIGSPNALYSYVDAFRFLSRAAAVVQQGYGTHSGNVFRLTAEMGSAPEAELSSMEAVHETLQTDFTMGSDMRLNTYHLTTIRSSLTKNLAPRFPDVHDEIVCAFEDLLALEGKERRLIPVLGTMIDVVARATNRLFIGLPYCRNKEFLKFSVQNTVDIMVGAQIIGMLPTFLRPIIGPFISPRKRNLKTGEGYLRLLVKGRLAMEEEHGSNWEGRPNDLISWLLDAAPPERCTVPSLVLHILSFNMTAILHRWCVLYRLITVRLTHSPNKTFTHAIYDLAAFPEYASAMREEAAHAVRADGWSATALANMHKIDSFLPESQRFNGIHVVNMMRKVMKPGGYQMSDGTLLPPGSFVSVAVRTAHHDPEFYVSPYVFDGFRFSKMRESADAAFKHHFVTTGVDLLSFGLGKHTCPGRFFAVVELKAMLAHVVLNCEVELETEGVRPPDDEFGGMRMPNLRPGVFFRRR
ncbi:cytochrome P450 [Mycena sp. CBHHK59/15]|nr:cytochrome P450 [Mycena sp. CBHHK59/15]